MAFYKMFLRNPTKMLKILISHPCIMIGSITSIDSLKRYMDYLNEKRFELLELKVTESLYASIFYTLHGVPPRYKYETPEMIDPLSLYIEVQYNIVNVENRSESHRFQSADPAIAKTFNQRYSNKVTRKHNKRRYK